MRKLKLIGLFFLCILGFIQASYSHHYIVKKLRLSSEIDQVLIRDLTVDSLGFIWYLANNEIYRYDGFRSLNVSNTLQNQTHIQDFPQNIICDKRNRLWIIGNETIQFLDLKKWELVTIDNRLLSKFPSGLITSAKLLNNEFLTLIFESGEVIIHHQNKFHVIEDLQEIAFPSQTKVVPRSMTYWNNQIWIGTTTGDLMSIKPQENFRSEFHELKGIEAPINNLIDGEGGIFLNVFPNLLYHFESENSFYPVEKEGFQPNAMDFYVVEGGKNLNVFADSRRILILNKNFDVQFESLMPLKNEFGPKHVIIHENEVILGTEEGIVVVYPKIEGLNQLVPENQSANKSVRGIHVYEDKSYFYTSYQGAGFVDPSGRHSFLPHLKHGYVLYPLPDEKLLIGTQGGFLKGFDRHTLKLSDIPLELEDDSKSGLILGDLPTYILSLEENKDSYIIGSLAGLWLLDKKSRKIRRAPDNENNAQYLDLHIRDILKKGEEDYVLSTQFGLYSYSQGNWKKLYPKRNAMGVYSTTFYKGHYYLATQGGGIHVLDGNFRVVKVLDRSKGLGHNVVYSLEKANDVWIAGTADGVNFIKGDSIRLLNVSDGLIQSEFNSSASFYDSLDNKVYMGGLNGYAVFDMDLNWFNEVQSYKSYITELHTISSLDGKRKALFNWPYMGAKNLHLKPHESLVGLYLGVPHNYKSQINIRYYINDGLGEFLKNDPFISLIQSEPGKYSVKIQTFNRGQIVHEDFVQVVKDPQFFQSWKFRILVILAVMILLYLWYLNRIEKLKTEQKLRNQIASDLHDEVGSYLTRIYYQSQNSLLNKEDNSDTKKHFNQIAHTSKAALFTMSDLVWSIEPKFDTLQDLVIRMKDYAFKMKEESDFCYTFEESVSTLNRGISQNLRQNIFLIYKEALNNALKYGENTRISFHLVEDNVLELKVENRIKNDHDWHSAQGGNGLIYMKARVEKVKGDLQIEREGEEFKLNIKFPLQKGMFSSV